MVDAFSVWAISHFNQWSTTGPSKVVVFPVCVQVHIKDPLLLIGKSNLCGDSRFPLKKYVTMTICGSSVLLPRIYCIYSNIIEKITVQ